MPVHQVDLTEPVPEWLADELARRVHFVAEEIERFDLVVADGYVTALHLSLSTPLAVDTLRRKLDRVVATEVLPQRNVPTREVWRSSHAEAVVPDVFEEMLVRGIVTPSGEGQMAFGRPFTDLLSALDRWLVQLARRVVQADERRYPALLPTSVLARSGYVRSFPQFLLFAGRLHGDIDEYEAFLADLHDEPDAPGDVVDRHSLHAGYVLSPAVCYHVYHQLADSELVVPLLGVTACGTCHRHESRYHRTLARLWEFTMREIVLLGDGPAVAEARRRLMDEVFGLVERLGLAGCCEAASDPFFCDARSAQMAWSQRALELKYELLMPVSDGGRVAAASFNVHSSVLGEAFGIATPDGDPIHTGCVAFGLERLAYAFVSRHGLDPRSWPELEAEECLR